jgi:hypothetical protein
MTFEVLRAQSGTALHFRLQAKPRFQNCTVWKRALAILSLFRNHSCASPRFE